MNAREKNHIVVFGGANMEYILKPVSELIDGGKNFVEIDELFGGSGVNYSLRLLSCEQIVYPVLFLGDDATGERIYSELKRFSSEENSIFFERGRFFVPNLKSIRSVIIVDGHKRTILSEDQNKENIFFEFAKKRVQDIDSVDSVIIGHIHNDRMQINKDSSKLTTKFIIDHFKDKDILIYANFGASQLEYGFSFWSEYINSIDILQLNMLEFKKFLGEDPECSIYMLIKKIWDIDINAIITLDKFGAIGILKDEKDAIFFARPVSKIEGFIDSTGAGDAFCAGMVAYLGGKKEIEKDEFMVAMEYARTWATYACRSYGGANSCPNRYEIESYHSKLIEDSKVVYYKDKEMRDILSLIDTLIEKDS